MRILGIILLFLFLSCGQKLNIEPQITYFQSFNVEEYISANEFVANELFEIANNAPLSEDDILKYVNLYETHVQITAFYTKFTDTKLQLKAAVEVDNYEKVNELAVNIPLLENEWNIIKQKLKMYGWEYGS